MSLRLSEQHGVNPSVEQCFTCMKDVGVVLFGKINAGRHARPADRDPQAPPRVCFGPNSEPCAECRKHMEMGIILISVDESKTDDEQNPWRSGGWVVVKEDVIKRLGLSEAHEKQILNKRCAFLTDETWDMIGLPRGGGEQREGV